MGSVLDQLLDFLPTSRDIRNLIPSAPRLDVRGQSQSCAKATSKSVTHCVHLFLNRISRNPHQSVAIFFLLGLGFVFWLDGQQKYNGSTASQVRGRAGGGVGLSIVTDYGSANEDDKAKPQHAPRLKLPPHFNYLVNRNDAKVNAAPVFWYLPRSGGNTMTEIFGKCRGMVIAGAWMGASDKLQIVHENGMKQVTADLRTKIGRNKARDMGLKDAHSNILIVSPNVYETSEVFGGSFQAELWTWFRHPVERQISYYFYLKSLPAGHPQYNPLMQALSISDWTQTPFHTPNPMLTTLLGVPCNPMGWTEIDLTVAKNLLRDKAVIGLLDQKTESVRRFLYGRQLGASGARECQERLLDYAWSTKGRHDPVGRKSDAYQLLAQSNSLDMKLYEYAVYLFDEQAERYGHG